MRLIPPGYFSYEHTSDRPKQNAISISQHRNVTDQVCLGLPGTQDMESIKKRQRELKNIQDLQGLFHDHKVEGYRAGGLNMLSGRTFDDHSLRIVTATKADHAAAWAHDCEVETRIEVNPEYKAGQNRHVASSRRCSLPQSTQRTVPIQKHHIRSEDSHLCSGCK
ncbi:hypothetical protein NPIL_93301 [Nephila pilipes]|uniref:Uncharacterized protein n=1 Tax=Nephila pilipes TaxID=299642 RepID=A0A8X6NFY1_NEPPI|nr:hypothetical protein NPIL_93301 [Nephila pilipes]